jgi:hypothetical protein
LRKLASHELSAFSEAAGFTDDFPDAETKKDTTRAWLS